MDQAKNLTGNMYVFVFAFAFLSLKKAFIWDVNPFLLGGILCVLGGLLGHLVYRLVQNKVVYIKYGVPAVMLVVIFGLSFLAKKHPDKPMNLVEYYQNNVLKPDLDKAFNKAITHPYKVPVLTDEQRKKLITCEICGYKALCPDSTYCYNCVCEVFDTSLYRPNEKLDWLKNEQSKYFMMDSVGQKVNFYEPKIQDGFKKDPKWKPVITEQEAIEGSF